MNRPTLPPDAMPQLYGDTEADVRTARVMTKTFYGSRLIESPSLPVHGSAPAPDKRHTPPMGAPPACLEPQTARVTQERVAALRSNGPPPLRQPPRSRNAQPLATPVPGRSPISRQDPRHKGTGPGNPSPIIPGTGISNKSPGVRRTKQEQPTAPYPVVGVPSDLPDDEKGVGPTRINVPPPQTNEVTPSLSSAPPTQSAVQPSKQLTVEEMRDRFPITAAWLSGALVAVIAHSLARGDRWEIGPLERASGSHVIWLRPGAPRTEQVAAWLAWLYIPPSTSTKLP